MQCAAFPACRSTHLQAPQPYHHLHQPTGPGSAHKGHCPPPAGECCQTSPRGCLHTQAPVIAQYRCYQPAVSFISLKPWCLSQGRATLQGNIAFLWSAPSSQHFCSSLVFRAMWDEVWKRETPKLTVSRRSWVLRGLSQHWSRWCTSCLLRARGPGLATRPHSFSRGSQAIQLTQPTAPPTTHRTLSSG